MEDGYDSVLREEPVPPTSGCNVRLSKIPERLDLLNFIVERKKKHIWRCQKENLSHNFPF